MADKSRTHGPKPLDAKDKRTHTVSVRLNEAELEQLDSERAERKMQRGAYLRSAFLNQVPPVVPEINRQAWFELSKAAANLNQIAKALNHGKPVGLGEIIDQLAKFRCMLLEADKK
ncbi:plasmid mobilization protein [Vibrio cholerae]